jgi:hypothetical protein
VKKKQKVKPAVAELGRAEHEDRENARHRIKRLRGHQEQLPKARTVRERRIAGKHGDPNV